MNKDPRIQFFDHHAPKWDTFGPPIEQVLARLETLQPTIGLKRGMDVLEIGCGTGRVTPWLVNAVAPGCVTALDFSPAMVDRARERDAAASYRVADACSDDLGEGLFDVVFCMHVFPHFRDPATALRNIARALKPGGRLVVLHLVGRESLNTIHHDAGGPVAGDRLPNPEAWLSLLAVAGMESGELIDGKDLFLAPAVHQSIR